MKGENIFHGVHEYNKIYIHFFKFLDNKTYNRPLVKTINNPRYQSVCIFFSTKQI